MRKILLALCLAAVLVPALATASFALESRLPAYGEAEATEHHGGHGHYRGGRGGGRGWGCRGGW